MLSCTSKMPNSLHFFCLICWALHEWQVHEAWRLQVFQMSSFLYCSFSPLNSLRCTTMLEKLVLIRLLDRSLQDKFQFSNLRSKDIDIFIRLGNILEPVIITDQQCKLMQFIVLLKHDNDNLSVQIIQNIAFYWYLSFPIRKVYVFV